MDIYTVQKWCLDGKKNLFPAGSLLFERLRRAHVWRGRRLRLEDLWSCPAGAGVG